MRGLPTHPPSSSVQSISPSSAFLLLNLQRGGLPHPLPYLRIIPLSRMRMCGGGVDGHYNVYYFICVGRGGSGREGEASSQLRKIIQKQISKGSRAPFGMVLGWLRASPRAPAFEKRRKTKTTQLLEGSQRRLAGGTFWLGVGLFVYSFFVTFS